MTAIKEKIKWIVQHSDKEEQERQVMEECGELIQAVNKYHRHPILLSCRNNLVEEMADVSIMIKQLQTMYDIPDKELKSKIEEKVKRQIKRIKEKD